LKFQNRFLRNYVLWSDNIDDDDDDDDDDDNNNNNNNSKYNSDGNIKRVEHYWHSANVSHLRALWSLYTELDANVLQSALVAAAAAAVE